MGIHTYTQGERQSSNLKSGKGIQVQEWKQIRNYLGRGNWEANKFPSLFLILKLLPSNAIS